MTFVRLMNEVLRGYLDEFAQVYLDDIVIFSANQDEHRYMNTDKVVEMLEKRAEPLLWAAYCRGWADRTADLVKTLSSSAARSPGTPSTAKPPRPSTYQRFPTTKATGSGRVRAATGTTTATLTTPATKTKTPPQRQPTRPASTQRDITWVRPAPGRPLVPRMPPADPHPPTTEWTGMPSRVAYMTACRHHHLHLPPTSQDHWSPGPRPSNRQSLQPQHRRGRQNGPRSGTSAAEETAGKSRKGSFESAVPADEGDPLG
ncbi:predicted GPI-anchored protein 58 [Sipha flava]|uniref:Predicted GPI-anchored protein 58 n=1 Tax=Sipha flava TaxID=143950 RepID=A0A8B8F6V3_9HEMI|nr:predicted GPI-anchored protein 58 [Sipha flava]